MNTSQLLTVLACFGAALAHQCPANHRHSRFTERHYHHGRQAPSAHGTGIRLRDQNEGLRIDSLVGKRTIWSGPALGEGKHTIVFDYKPDEPGLGKSGKGVLTVNGKEVATNTMEHGTPVTYPEDESFDVGSDTRTGVAMLKHRYNVPFRFTGEINKLTFKLAPHAPAPGHKAEMAPIPAPEPDPIDTAQR